MRTATSLAVAVVLAACGVENAPPPQTGANAAATSGDGGVEDVFSVALGQPTVDKRVADVKASFDAQNAHDAAAVAAFFAMDALIRGPGTPDWKGRDVIRAEEEKAFVEAPDLRYGPRRILVTSDVAIVEWTATGTTTLTKKAGARPFGANGVSVMWFSADGLIREEHDMMNEPTVIAQAGGGKGKTREVQLQPSGTPDVRVGQGTPDEAKNAEMSKGFDRALEAHDEKTWSEFFADDVLWDDYSAPAPLTGKADVVRALAAVSAALPDQKLACKVWAVEDFVAKECTRTATHEGVLPLGSLKVPATHRFVESHFVDILQMKGFRVQKGIRYADNLEMATALGLVGEEKPSPKKKK